MFTLLFNTVGAQTRVGSSGISANFMILKEQSYTFTWSIWNVTAQIQPNEVDFVTRQIMDRARRPAGTQTAAFSYPTALILMAFHARTEVCGTPSVPDASVQKDSLAVTVVDAEVETKCGQLCSGRSQMEPHTFRT